MEVPNDESARASPSDWECCEKIMTDSPLLLPWAFFSHIFLAFSHLPANRVSLSLRRGGSFNSDQNKVAPKANSSLYVLPWEKLISLIPPSPASTDCAHRLPRVIWNFLPRPNARVWVPSFITASKKKLHTHSLFRTHTASQQQRCKLSSKSVIIILWRPWLCIGTYCCGLILYKYIYLYMWTCAGRKSVGPLYNRIYIAAWQTMQCNAVWIIIVVTLNYRREKSRWGWGHHSVRRIFYALLKRLLRSTHACVHFNPQGENFHNFGVAIILSWTHIYNLPFPWSEKILLFSRLVFIIAQFYNFTFVKQIIFQLVFCTIL